MTAADSGAPSHPRWAGAVVVSVALIAATVLSVRATRAGMAVSPDSAAYIGAARNLLAGHGLSVAGELLAGGGATASASANAHSPLVHFPPLYPLMLAAGGAFGVDPYDASRWIAVLSLLALVLLLHEGVRRSCEGQIWPAAVATGVFVLSPVTTQLHLFANSEPPFLVLQALSLFFLARYLDHPRALILIIASACAALATMTRYVGVAGILTAGVALLMMSPDRPWRRRRATLIFFAIALLPMVLWSLRNAHLADTATNREWAVHPVTFTQLRDAADLISMWFMPQSIQRRWRLLALAATVSGVAASVALTLWRAAGVRDDSSSKAEPSALVPVVALFAAVYVVFVITSISFFDAATPLDDRILFPLFVAGTFLLPTYLYRMTRAARAMPARRASAAVAAAVVVMLGVVAVRGTGAWVKARPEGLDYASARWRESELAAYVRSLPPDRVVYTNAPDAVSFLTGRNCHWIPREWHTWSLKPNVDFEAEFQRMHGALRNRAAVIAHFEKVRHRNYLVSMDAIIAITPLPSVATFADGAAYAMELNGS